MIHCWGRTVLPDAKDTLTRGEFTSLVYTPIEQTPVNAVLFSFGSGNVAEYQSEVLEWPGQADEFRFPQSRTWHGGIETDPKDQYENPRALAQAGHNPPVVIVEECRTRKLGAFVSLRMNDCHDGLRSRGTLPNPELATFKRLNPDWLVQDLDRWTALNFRRPQVRALKLRVVEEFFDRWDFDGIELDWLRHTLYFPRGTERENGKHLTELLRAIRRSLNAHGLKRGRPVEIFVRVPERLEWCLEAGFDVPTWLDEDLVDALILGQGLTEAPGLDEFRAKMRRRIPIYGSVYSYGNGYRLSPDAVIRGSAANLWRDGVDGLYTFNWFTYGSWRQRVLRDIADPATLRDKDKHYTLPHRFDAARGAGTDYLRFNTPYKSAQVPFELHRADARKDLSLPVAEASETAELWLAVEYSRPGDVLAVTLNGRPLGGDREIFEQWEPTGYDLVLPACNGMLGLPYSSKVDMKFPALRYPVPAGMLVAGRNQLSIELKKRGGGSAMRLQITRVELATRFKPPTGALRGRRGR